jgi:hypothetical protein
MKKVYKSFKIAGIEYYEAFRVLEKLKPGVLLKLVPDEKNIYDEDAVCVYFQDTMLGYVPKTANYSISRILKAGWNIFEAYVQYVKPHEYEVYVAVFVRENE